MKTQEFRRPGSLVAVARRPYEGPPSFLVWTPHSSRIYLQAQDWQDSDQWPQDAETLAALNEWLDEVGPW